MSTGLELLPSGFYRARFRTGAGRVRIDLHVTGETAAIERRDRLQAMVSSLVRAKLYSAAAALLDEGARAKDGRAFLAVERAARATLQEAATEPDAPRKKTYRELTEAWLDGELVKIDQTIGKRAERSAREILAMFSRYVFPLVGDLAIDAVDAAHLMQVRKAFAKLGGRSIRAYCRLTLYVLRVANYPLQLRGPLPVDPKQYCKAVIPKHEFGWLYPSEECQIVSNPDEPIDKRTCLGFMARNGTRVTETTHLRWRMFDLDAAHLVIPAEITKTKKRRAFTLDPDVVEALRAHRERARAAGGGGADDRVFPYDRNGFRKWLLAALPRCGVTRAEVLVTTEYQRRLRLHDLRATFCTVGVFDGRTERQLRERTGHLTQSEFERYVRQAKTAPEREHGWFSPLDKCLSGAIRGLPVGHVVGLDPKKTGGNGPGRTSVDNDPRQKHAPQTAVFSGKTQKRGARKTADSGFGPPRIDTVGHADAPSPVGAQLAEQAATIADLRAALAALQAAAANPPKQLAKAQPKRRSRRRR